MLPWPPDFVLQLLVAVVCSAAASVWWRLHRRQPRRSGDKPAKSRHTGYFPPHWSEEELRRGVSERRLGTGVIAVSRTQRQRAWVRGAAGDSQRDFLLDGERARNRALEGDLVGVDLEAAQVVGVLERRHRSELVGYLRASERVDPERRELLSRQLQDFVADAEKPALAFAATLKPVERKLVHELAAELGLAANSSGAGNERYIIVSKVAEEPEGEGADDGQIQANADVVELFVATIHDQWLPEHRFPKVARLRYLGRSDSPETHTSAILVENAVPEEGAAPEALAECGADEAEGEERIQQAVPGRRDFRGLPVFCIDPASARDLDDALHVVPLDGQSLFEVAVHIADAAHWVEDGGALDRHARARCTSTYLTTTMRPMLPRQLSEHLCSLQGGKDRLTMSVVLRMSGDGRPDGDPWFGPGVIRSRGKLSYEEAQATLDAFEREGLAAAASCCRSARELAEEDAAESIAEALKHLSCLASCLKASGQRRGGGSFRPCFRVDESDRVILESDEDPAAEAHSLVEQFMLLANRLVAEHLSARLPTRALLRVQPPPRADRFRAWAAHIQELARQEPSLACWASLQPTDLTQVMDKLEAAAAGLDAEERPGRAAALRALAYLGVRTMSSAEYACGPEATGGHWSLGLAGYTHFTSPIRRYSDLLVHRELKGLLGGDAAPDGDDGARAAAAAAIATVNARASRAKFAQQDAQHLLLVRWVMQAKQPVLLSGVVIGLGRSHATVLVTRLGLEVQCRFLDVDGCARYRPETGEKAGGDPAGDDVKGERVRRVRLFAEAEEGEPPELAALSELDVVLVRLDGYLGRYPLVRARIVLPAPSVPGPPSLARGASDELARVLSRRGASNLHED